MTQRTATTVPDGWPDPTHRVHVVCCTSCAARAAARTGGRIGLAWGAHHRCGTRAPDPGLRHALSAVPSTLPRLTASLRRRREVDLRRPTVASLSAGALLLSASCTYPLPALPAGSDAGRDAPLLEERCPIADTVDSPSCPAGSGHCDRVRVTLPAAPGWRVGPSGVNPEDTSSFEASGGRVLEIDVFEVDVARYRRFARSTSFGTTLRVAYPGGVELEGVGALPVPTDMPERPFCTYSEEASADALPVNCLDWSSALAFCAFDGGRLPTLAELEYVRRWWPVEGVDPPGADGRRYPWGDAEPDARFSPLPPRFAGGPAQSAPMPAEEGEPIGCLHGIAGGVAEWLADGAGLSLDDPCFDDGFCSESTERRLVATGAWRDSSTEWMRSSAFAPRYPSESNSMRGVRCVYDVP